MKVDDTLLDHIAELARLEFQDEEREEIKNDMTRILGFIEEMNAVNTDQVEPLVYMSDARNVMREDDVRTEITQQEALKNAPDRDSDYFKVPKVIDKK